MAFYSALDPREKQVRLLVLKPAAKGTRIECVLQAVSLEAEPIPYEALSYTWGPARESHTITVDGVNQLRVTDNLWYALQRLRNEVSERVLCDAICINQTDDEERGHQVPMMFDIYSEAQRTIVWLGESDRSPIVGREMQNLHDDVTMGDLDKAICGTEALWWNRAWIIQEMVASQDVVVYFGAQIMSWTSFFELFGRPGRYDLGEIHTWLDGARFRFKNQILNIHRLRSGWSRAKYRFVDLAENTRTASATDPRDKVYSMLGMMHPTAANLIRANYAESIAQVYTKATYAAIKVEGDFDMLSHISFRHDRIPGLPSWVVDFTQTENSSEGIMAPFGRPDVDTAKQRFTRTTRTEVSLSNDMRYLYSDGRTLDVIDNIHVVTTEDCMWSSYAEVSSLWSTLCKGLRQAAHHQPLIFKVLQHSGNPVHQHETELLTDFEPEETTVLGALEKAFKMFEILSGWYQRLSTPIDEASSGFIWRIYPLFLYSQEASDAAAVFTTRNGFLGVGPATVRPGDQVALLRGNRLPVILHPGAGTVTFQGFAYVHGTVDLSLDSVELENFWWECELQDTKFVIQ